MGIHDRDYIRDKGGPKVTHHANAMLGRGFTIVAGIIFAAIVLRVPSPLYIKFPLLVGLGFLIRYFWRVPNPGEGEFYRKQGIHAEKQKEFDRAERCYELAAKKLPKDFDVRLRLLSLYDSTNRPLKAERLIDSMDGIEVPGSQFEQFEHLVLKYRRAEFIEDGDEFRLRL